MRICLAVFVLCFSASFVYADDAFEKEVRPLLVQHYVGCLSFTLR